MSISVKKTDGNRYTVTVSDGRGETQHRVTVQPAFAQKLTAGRIATDELVQRSFEFLLQREPKEDILPEFDLAVIGRYFPEFESEIRKRIQPN